MIDKNPSRNLIKEGERSVVILKVLFLLVTISLASLLSSSASLHIGIFQSTMALQQHQPETETALVSPSSSSPSQSAIPTPSVQYYNSTYGIVFQSPYGWNKIELLSGRITTVVFTSPIGHVSIVISIEKGLGKVTTLGQLMKLPRRHYTQHLVISSTLRQGMLLF